MIFSSDVAVEVIHVCVQIGLDVRLTHDNFYLILLMKFASTGSDFGNWYKVCNRESMFGDPILNSQTVKKRFTGCTFSKQWQTSYWSFFKWLLGLHERCNFILFPWYFFPWFPWCLTLRIQPNKTNRFCLVEFAMLRKTNRFTIY